jgi:hypothetical protein
MALTASLIVTRRGPRKGSAFGYPVAPGEKIFSGGLVCVNAAGQLVRLQTAGAVAFVGMAQSAYDNSGSAAAGPIVVAANDSFALAVPSATPSNINAKVYATDDATLTLTAPTSGFEGVVGYLEGIDNGQTYVALAGH